MKSTLRSQSTHPDMKIKIHLMTPNLSRKEGFMQTSTRSDLILNELTVKGHTRIKTRA